MLIPDTEVYDTLDWQGLTCPNWLIAQQSSAFLYKDNLWLIMPLNVLELQLHTNIPEEDRKIPLQVCYLEGYCDESFNLNSGKENKRKGHGQLDEL